MAVAEQFVAVVEPHGGRYEIFLYQPGEELPPNGVCSASHPGKNGSYERKQLQSVLKPVLKDHDISPGDVSNWNSF